MEINVKALYTAGFEYIPIPDSEAPTILNQLMLYEMREEFILNSIGVEELMGMPEFQELIKNIMDQQIIINVDLVKEASKLDLFRADFLDSINGDVDKLLQGNYDNVKDYTQQFYEVGKEKGFNQLQVKQFVSQVDTHALFNLTNYNFDLIKNVSSDVTRHIRKEVWEGVSRDESVVQIAERIKLTGIEPIETNTGRLFTVEQRASMIARTESMRASNQGLVNSYLQYGVKSFNSKVTKTKGTCQDCLDIEADGPYSIEKDSDKIPPHHPHCNCYPEPDDEPDSEGHDPESFPDLVSGEEINTNPHINFGKEFYSEGVQKNKFEIYDGNIRYKKGEDYITRSYPQDNITIRKTISNRVQKLLTHDNILEEFKSWPDALKKNIQSINMSKFTKITGAGRYIEGVVESGGKDIHIFEYPKRLLLRAVRGNKVLNDYLNTARHEAFHIFDNFKLDGTKQIGRLSSSQGWIDAIQKDKEFYLANQDSNIFKKGGEGIFHENLGSSPSRHSLESFSEDFAESGRRFLDPKDKYFAKQFPNRYKYIQEQLNLL